MTTETLRSLVLLLARSAPFDLDPREVERLTVPDTTAVAEADGLIEGAAKLPLVNHSARSYVWGALLGLTENRAFDAELFYVSALLHDIGLTASFDRGNCFEIDGGDAARELLVRVGWSGERAEAAAHAIREHWDGPESENDTEALLLAYGTSVDVSGRRAREFDEAVRAAVVDAFPRAGFKRHFIELSEDQARRKPGCRVTRAVEDGLAERVLAAPFSE